MRTSVPRGVSAWIGGTYASSWVDVLQAAVVRLPWTPWVTYLTVFLVLAGIETVLKWSTGVYPAGTFFPWHVVGSGTGVYALALMHYLDDVADEALDAFRPVMTATEAEVEAVRASLTTMPAAPVVLATLVGALVGVAQRALVSSHNLEGIGYATGGPVFVYEYTLMLWVFVGLAVLVYHTFRQLRLVDVLYRECAMVRLFDPAPLYAFSRVAARTALGVVFIAYLWFVTYPRSTAGSSTLVFVIVMVVLAVLAIVTYVWPLWGAHQRLEAEKLRRKTDTHARIDFVLEQQRARIAAEDHTALQGGNHAMASLSAELGLLDKASTWPWQAGALRSFLTAVMLPLMVWLVQQVLSRWLPVP